MRSQKAGHFQLDSNRHVALWGKMGVLRETFYLNCRTLFKLISLGKGCTVGYISCQDAFGKLYLDPKNF